MYALTSVCIPASVTSIGTYGFFGGTSNTGITVHADNPNYSSLDGVLYNKDKTTLIQYPCGKAGALATPASVTSIGIAAFELAAYMTSVTFTGSVKSIGRQRLKLYRFNQYYIPTALRASGIGLFMVAPV